MPEYKLTERIYYFSSFNWEDSNAWNQGIIDGACYTAGVNTYYYGNKKKSPTNRGDRTVIDLRAFLKPDPPSPPYPPGSYYINRVYLGNSYSYASFRSMVYPNYCVLTLYLDYIYPNFEIRDNKVWELKKVFVTGTYYPAESFNGESYLYTIVAQQLIGMRINLICDSEASQPESEFIANVCYIKFVEYLITPISISFNFGLFTPQKRNF